VINILKDLKSSKHLPKNCYSWRVYVHQLFNTSDDRNTKK